MENWHDKYFGGGNDFTFDQAKQIKIDMAKATGIQHSDMDWSDEATRSFQKWLNSSPIDWIKGK